MIKKTVLIFSFLLLTLTRVYSLENAVELSANWHKHLHDDLIEQMKRCFGVDTLLETGTLNGSNAGCAAKHFKQVHTVELSAKLYELARNHLKNYHNVHCYFGDSAEMISVMIENAQGRILFWLDAHCSGGDTAGYGTDPLLLELAQIGKSGRYDSVILIDDIRGHPIAKINEILTQIDADYVSWIIGDIMLAYNKKYHSPNISPLVEACTLSRNARDISQIIEAEKRIIHLEPSSEKERLKDLHQQFGGGIYSLWDGLRNLGAKNYAPAIACLISARDLSKHPWRVNAYLVQAYHESGDLSAAERTFQLLLPFIDKNEVAMRQILGDHTFDIYRFSTLQMHTSWPYGSVRVIGDSHAAFCFTVAKSWEEHNTKKMPKEATIELSDGSTSLVPWTVSWIGPITMHRMGRGGCHRCR